MTSVGAIPYAAELPCADCGRQARDYHHHLGYEHPEAVIPLCPKCHATRHRIGMEN